MMGVRRVLGVVSLVALTGVCAAAGVQLPASASVMAPPTPTAAGEEPAAGEPVLVPELSTETSTTYRLPDGMYSMDTGLSVVNYQDDAGEWHQVDNTLVEAGGAAWAVRNDEAGYTVKIPQDAGSTPVRVSADGAWVSMKLRGLDGAPDVAGDTASFAQIASADEVTYRATGEGIKESIVLQEPPAGPGPAVYAYDLAASTGLSARLTDSDEVEFVDAQGKVRFVVPAGNMTDSASPAAYTDAVDFDLTMQPGGWKLTMTPDAGWLRDSARVYPVVIDPGLQFTQGPANDCLLRQAVPTGFNCGSNELEVGKLAGSTRRRSVLRFTLAGLPPGASIYHANLELWFTRAYSISPTLPADYRVQATGKDFSPGATWTSSGNFGAWTGGDPLTANASPVFRLGGSSAPGWRYWEVKEIVKGWHADLETKTGFVIKQASEGEAENYVYFASNEYSTTSRRPNLNVLYYPGPTVSPQVPNCVDAGDSDGTVKVNVTNPSSETSSATINVTFPGRSSQSVSVPANQTRTVVFTGVSPGSYSGRASFVGDYTGAYTDYTATVSGCSTRTPGPTQADAGDRPFWTFTETELTDRITSKVNVGTGNLLLQAQDVSVEGVAGWDLALARYYNSANAVGSGASVGNMGAGWSTGFGDSVRLQAEGNGDRFFFGPSGYRAKFVNKSADGTFDRTRPGIKADLKEESDGSFTLTWYDKGKYTFDANGRLQTTRDHNGNQLGFNYSAGKLSTVVDTRGRSALFSYNAQGQVSKVEVRKPDNTVMVRWVYGYDNGLLTSSKLDYVDNTAVGGTYANPGNDPTIGAATTYTYNAQGYLASITDARKNATGSGGVTQFGYDAQMRLATQTRVPASGSSSVTSYAYYAGTDSAACKNNNEVVDADAHNHTRVDGERLASDIKDVTKYCNDDVGRVLRTTDARGNQRSQSWDAQSNVDEADLSGTGSGAEKYDFEYDQNDNAKKSTTPEGAVAEASYNDTVNDHSPTEVKDDYSSGSSTPQPSWGYDYDDKNNLIKARSLGNEVDVEYRYCWTSVGQILRIDPLTQSGTKASSTNPKRDTSASNRCEGDTAQGNDTLFTYNSDHELTGVDRPTGGDVSMTYDKLSRLATVTDARGVTTTYSYDGLDRIVRAVYSKAGELDRTVNWTYDLAGNLTYLGDANGNNTFGYDSLNRLTSESDGTVAGPISSSDYGYDTAGNVRRVTERNNLAQVDYSTGYTYNAVNKPIGVSYSAALTSGVTVMDARQITMSYDRKDRRTQTTWVGAPGQPNVVQEARYDEDGDTTCIYSFKSTTTLGNGPDDCPSLTAPQASGLINFYHYDYTNNGTRTELKWGMTELGGRHTRFDYDPIQRLKSAITKPSDGASTSLRHFEYGYDRHSNLVKERVSGDSPTPGLREGTQWAAFDAGDQICATARGATDPGVTCTSSVSGQTSFAHDNAGNLTSAAGGATQDLDGLGLAYNLPGQTASITPPGAMTAIPQAYDGVEQDRRTSSGSTQMAYGFAGLSHQATPLSGQSSGHGEWFVRDPEGMVLAMVDTTSPTAPTVAGYYLTDDQDSVMAVITPAANSATRYLYEPYGETIHTWTDPSPGTSSSKYTEDGSATTPTMDHNPWRYVSGYHDKATGFLKFGTRYYMPAHATWTQPDPENGREGNPLTLNRHNYAGCNPISQSDGSGRAYEDPLTADCAMAYAGTIFAGGLVVAATFVAGPVGLAASVVGLGFASYGLYTECYE